MALFEDRHGQDAGLLQMTRPLHRILGRGTSLVVLPDMDQRKAAYAAITLARHLGDHLDQR